MTEQSINQLHNDRISMLGKMAASMAHEIRNPLFAIEGFLKLLRSRLTEDSLAKVERYLQIIEHEFKGLYSQITGILSFAKNNSLEELLLPCSMKEIVYHVNNLVAPRLIDDNIELEIDTQDDFVIPIQKVAIQQVLTNLINNSIDAFAECDTTPRLIRLTVWQNEQRCGLSVMDTGPGIPESIRETIFEPFVSGKSNGTGLGLSICRQILSKNNGDLSFTSHVGETVFTLSFDASAIQSAENYAI